MSIITMHLVSPTCVRVENNLNFFFIWRSWDRLANDFTIWILLQ